VLPLAGYSRQAQDFIELCVSKSERLFANAPCGGNQR